MGVSRATKTLAAAMAALCATLLLALAAPAAAMLGGAEIAPSVMLIGRFDWQVRGS
jgi:hypothetical protein